MPLAGVSMNAQRVCSAFGSTPVGGCITAPVTVVPARVLSTCPDDTGIGDLRVLVRFHTGNANGTDALPRDEPL